MTQAKNTRAAMDKLLQEVTTAMMVLEEQVATLAAPGEHAKEQYSAMRINARYVIPDLLERLRYQANVQQCIESPDAVTLAVTNMIEAIDDTPQPKKEKKHAKGSNT